MCSSGCAEFRSGVREVARKAARDLRRLLRPNGWVVRRAVVRHLASGSGVTCCIFKSTIWIPCSRQPLSTTTPGVIRTEHMHDMPTIRSCGFFRVGDQRRMPLTRRYGCVIPTANDSLRLTLVGPTSTITIHVPGPLRAYCGGAAQLSISAHTVRAALEELQRSQSALYRNVCDETGTVRRHLNVFVNSDNVRDLDGVDTTLRPGDVVTILPAVSGG